MEESCNCKYSDILPIQNLEQPWITATVSTKKLMTYDWNMNLKCSTDYRHPPFFESVVEAHPYFIFYAKQFIYLHKKTSSMHQPFPSQKRILVWPVVLYLAQYLLIHCGSHFTGYDIFWISPFLLILNNHLPYKYNLPYTVTTFSYTVN